MKPSGFSRRVGIGSAIGILGLAAPRGEGQEVVPSFEFSVACPEEIRVAPGAAFERELEVVLDTASNPGDDGAQGWSFQLVSEGARIIHVTTRGTPPAEIAGCPPHTAPPGLECPGISEVGMCGDRTSATSAVALSLIGGATLPSRPVTVARIRIAGEAPGELGQGVDARLEFVDTCPGAVPGLRNVVTWRGSSLQPALAACSFRIVAGEPAFLRGDVNADGKRDIADPISLLGCKFLGTVCPGCWDSADGNDDGEVDLADAVSLLGYIFLGWAPPPSPGPACGPDPTEDELPACESECGP